MNLLIIPQRGLPGEPETMVSVNGEVITIDGADYDLSPVPDGGEADWPESPILAIQRTNGVLCVSVLVRLGDDAAAEQPDDPQRWSITNATGKVMIPAVPKEIEQWD